MKKLSKKGHREYLQGLYKKYPYIPAYSKIMGSYEYWTENQLMEAEQINAPVDTYRIDTGSLFSGKQEIPVAYTIDQIKNQQLVIELKQLAGK